MLREEAQTTCGRPPARLLMDDTLSAARIGPQLTNISDETEDIA